MLCGAFDSFSVVDVAFKTQDVFPGFCSRHIKIQPIPLYVAVAVACISANINHNSGRRLLNRIGALAVGIIFMDWRTVEFDPDDDGVPVVPPFVAFVEQRLLLLAGLTFFLLLEVDRVNGVTKMEEAKHLSSGFLGSIAQATCSKQADAERIFAEIGQKTADVDYAIHVLLAAGMSSPRLREIARRGIDIRGAGHAEIALPFVALVPLTCVALWSIYCCFVYLRGNIVVGFVPLLFVHSTSVAARLGLLLLLWQKPRDERCFVLKMMSKIVAVYMIICCPIIGVWETQPSRVAQYRVWFAVPVTVYTSMLGLACLGMKRLASLPFCGTALLQLFLARGRGCCVLRSEEPFRAPTRMETESDRDTSPSSTESTE
eukprot:s3045_g5.t1